MNSESRRGQRARLQLLRHPRLFEQLSQILKHGVFVVRARGIGDKVPGTGPTLVPLQPRYEWMGGASAC